MTGLPGMDDIERALEAECPPPVDMDRVRAVDVVARLLCAEDVAHHAERGYHVDDWDHVDDDVRHNILRAARAVVDGLAPAGYALVRLPEPDRADSEAAVWEVDYGPVYASVRDGGPYVDDWCASGGSSSPQDGRSTRSDRAGTTRTVVSMADPTVYFEVDGQPVPADDCSWLLIAPCGCACGITVTSRRGSTLASPADAHAQFTQNAEERRREVAAGWTTRLAKGRSAAELLVGPNDCPHTPTWGVEPRPELDGHQWARQYTSDYKGRTQHLVPDLGVGQRVANQFGAPHVAALCGAKTWHWHTDWWAVKDTPTCLRCEAKARKAAASAPVGGTGDPR